MSESVGKRIVVLGATSAIAQAACRCWARSGASFVLVGRDGAKLEAVAQDLVARGAPKAVVLVADVGESAGQAALFSEARAALGGVDTLFVAHGTLGSQSECEQSYEAAKKVFEVNFLSVVSLLTVAAPYFEEQGRGTIAVISSVAGDRGRKSNFVYGASKAALDSYLSGLRNRLSAKGVQVLTIKPGFVATPMTAHLKQGPLFATADAVGEGIVRAVEKKKDVVYLPWFWAGIMFVIRSIPEMIFKRLSL